MRPLIKDIRAVYTESGYVLRILTEQSPVEPQEYAIATEALCEFADDLVEEVGTMFGVEETNDE